MGPEIFFAVKFIAALTGTILLIVHMSKSWSNVTVTGQRMRYITLLGFASVIAGNSARHVIVGMSDIYAEHVLALVVCLALIGTIVESMIEDRQGRVREHF
jgi:hypothetical protein